MSRKKKIDFLTEVSKVASDPEAQAKADADAKTQAEAEWKPEREISETAMLVQEARAYYEDLKAKDALDPLACCGHCGRHHGEPYDTGKFRRNGKQKTHVTLVMSGASKPFVLPESQFALIPVPLEICNDCIKTMKADERDARDLVSEHNADPANASNKLPLVCNTFEWDYHNDFEYVVRENTIRQERLDRAKQLVEGQRTNRRSTGTHGHRGAPSDRF